MLCTFCPPTILGDFYRIPEKLPNCRRTTCAEHARQKLRPSKRLELYIFPEMEVKLRLKRGARICCPDQPRTNVWKPPLTDPRITDAGCALLELRSTADGHTELSPANFHCKSKISHADVEPTLQNSYRSLGFSSSKGPKGRQHEDLRALTLYVGVLLLIFCKKRTPPPHKKNFEGGILIVGFSVCFLKVSKSDCFKPCCLQFLR